MNKTLLTCLVLTLLWTWPAQAAGLLDQFEKRISKFTLDNGLTLLVAERERAPVASFVTFVDVGGVDEPAGHTGIAHFSEHMAFKGTTSIGTTDWSKEKQLLEKIDQAYAEWLQAEYGDAQSSQSPDTLRQDFERLRKQAQKYVIPNEFAKIIEQHGGTNLNAATSKDYTMYFCSLPANRAELWFSLESDRLMNPVFREFFTEKQVVLEERRMRVESNPIGRMVETLQSIAFSAHPYGDPTIGWKSDVITTTRSDMRDFYEEHYVPSQMTMAIAGDVDPKRMKRLAETYFGPMEPKQATSDFVSREPQQRGERRFTQVGPNQPVYIEAYHSVSRMHEDAESLEILADILARGRVSRLYKRLVEQEGLATSIQAFDGFPGDKYPGLFLLYAVPTKDADLEALIASIHNEIKNIRHNGVTEEELERARTRLRADVIRNVQSNLGLARRLAQAESQMGDWRKVFTILDDYDQVTAVEIQEAAQTYLQPDNRTAGRMLHRERERRGQ